jgi:hypothetical protein
VPERAGGLAPRGWAVGPLCPLGNDDLVGTERHPAGASLRSALRRAQGGTRLGSPAIDDDEEAGVPPERDRQEVEELVIAPRHHNPVVRHAIRVISAVCRPAIRGNASPGSPYSDPTRIDIEIAWLLEDAGAGTKVTLVHSGFSRTADQSDYPFGWRGFLESLKNVVEQGDAGQQRAASPNPC